MTGRKPTDSRRTEIVDAALKIIAEQGLSHFTVQAIAREIGITDAALFRHFASKEAIVNAAIDRVSATLAEGFDAHDVDPLQRLGRFFQHRSAILQSNPGIARLIVSELLAQVAPPEGVARIAGLRRRSLEFIRSCLDEAERHGLLAEGVGAQEAAVLTFGALMALTQAHGSLGTAGIHTLPYSVWLTLEHLFRADSRVPKSNRHGGARRGVVPRTDAPLPAPLSGSDRFSQSAAQPGREPSSRRPTRRT